MINFRKLKQGFSSSILDGGKKIYEQEQVLSAKIVELDSDTIRISSTVQGNFDNTQECEIEIDRYESEAVDSDCDCPYSYDCQHLAALVFYLETKLNEIVVNYSQEADLETSDAFDAEEKESLEAAFAAAQNKESERKSVEFQRELLSEYIHASKHLACSPFFLPKEHFEVDQAEIAITFSLDSQHAVSREKIPEIQLALRLPYRSKPLHIQNICEFLDAIRYSEPIYLAGKLCFFAKDSFGKVTWKLLHIIIQHARYVNTTRERHQRLAWLSWESFGRLLATAFHHTSIDTISTLPCLYFESLEHSLKAAAAPAHLRIKLEHLKVPAPKILLRPSLTLHDSEVQPEEVFFFECATPGIIHNNTYYRFADTIKRSHLQQLVDIRNMTIPEPLFGTFIENALPELSRFAEISHREVTDQFVTLPFVGPLEARCEIAYLDGELDATLYFLYDPVEVPAANNMLTQEHMGSFSKKEGIVARNLTEEKEILNSLFQGFVFNEETGTFSAKQSKKIVEFMTDTIPNNQDRVHFNCPENLLDQFIYDKTHFDLNLSESTNIGFYTLELKVDGNLDGVSLDLLWECISSRKTFIELERSKSRGRGRKPRGAGASKLPKILALDLEQITPVVQILDELSIDILDNHTKELPLWSLATINEELFKELPINFSMSKKLKNIQQQMLGGGKVKTSAIPKEVNATLRSYQTEGVQWLERLRLMHLNGILADDMGLGKTLQAIIAITQSLQVEPKSLSLIVCPTSLTYNWKEEFTKFNPNIKVLLVDGPPSCRKKLLETLDQYEVIITSYTLLQKDIETYGEKTFTYCILDEAQHIKNRSTHNAKSVKKVKAIHRLILTGTPIENSLDELWSLFDFLMPGLLSTYERFVEKYIRNAAYKNNIEQLRKKVAPFILRRMKVDVLKDLPPVSNIVYHCHLSNLQQELYKSYAQSAREELSKLVAKEGFDRVRIHVLATLTRLKQICCHPAIFAKETAEIGDSSKYDMLFELLETLIEGKHKTVIFSQYTRMLNIMREDLIARGIPYAYLDGSSKNRLDIVNRFNADENLPIFLVSLKAGGSGLNLVGADTVVHYDMWWNPAVENQATDRVHRIGQNQAVSSYKLVTLNTIEEKILQLQERKKGLVQKVVSGDDEVISKLTWEEVLELLEV